MNHWDQKPSRWTASKKQFTRTVYVTGNKRSSFMRRKPYERPLHITVSLYREAANLAASLYRAPITWCVCIFSVENPKRHDTGPTGWWDYSSIIPLTDENGLVWFQCNTSIYSKQEVSYFQQHIGGHHTIQDPWEQRLSDWHQLDIDLTKMFWINVSSMLILGFLCYAGIPWTQHLIIMIIFPMQVRLHCSIDTTTNSLVNVHENKTSHVTGL